MFVNCLKVSQRFPDYTRQLCIVLLLQILLLLPLWLLLLIGSIVRSVTVGADIISLVAAVEKSTHPNRTTSTGCFSLINVHRSVRWTFRQRGTPTVQSTRGPRIG